MKFTGRFNNEPAKCLLKITFTDTFPGVPKGTDDLCRQHRELNWCCFAPSTHKVFHSNL